MSELSHLDEQGRARMVDVSDKSQTARQARAMASVRMRPETVEAIRRQGLPKGDVLTVARISGVMAAKRTSDLIPLCHPLALTHVDVACTLGADRVEIRTEARTTGPTGVEMEALTAASIAALTIYDMCKAIDRGMVIEGLCLQSKSGGVHGDYRRPAED